MAFGADAQAKGSQASHLNVSGPSVGKPVLEVEGLDIEYRTEQGALRAVRDLSFTVHEHESLGVVGESGSGKSTLAMGVIRYLASNGRITAGSVRLNGRDLLSLSAREMRKLWGGEIAVVYQSPLSALNPSIRIGKQLAEVALQHLDMDRAVAGDHAHHMLEKVAMPDPDAVMRRYPHELSGGMLQRCVIAMALMTNPSLLIMDEPTTALDVTTQAVVLDLVAGLKRDFDSAILYITHDLGVISHICERVAVMYAGQLLELARLRDLLRRPLHPYTLALLGCIPFLQAVPEKRLLTTIPGSIPRLDELPLGCVFAPRCGFREPACTTAQPPLREVGEDHLTACRRWQVVPEPERERQHKRDGVGLRRQGDGVRAPLLATEDLQVRFKARRAWQGRREKRLVRAVDGVSFEIERGRTLGVVGESGSGKTTIARAIVGLTPLTEGDVRLGEQRLAARVRARPRGVLKELQMVFQNPDASLNPVRTVGEAIARPLVLLQGMGREQAAARGRELLRAVSLPETYFDRVPSELSGGEKQRVAIARAFAADPGIILCDEPISSLDVSVQGSLMNLLMQLQAERETSYMFISHDLSAVQHLSDEIIVVYLGRIVESGPAASVLSPPYHPYTEALLSAVPIAEPDLPRTPLRLGGSVPSAMDVPPGCRFHPRCPRVLGSICAEQEPPWQEGEGAIRICCHIPLRELVRLQAEAAGDAQTKGTH